jgi:hypothetical protein
MNSDRLRVKGRFQRNSCVSGGIQMVSKLITASA